MKSTKGNIKKMKVQRIDIGDIFAWKTKDGFLEGTATVTRTGVFKYMNTDGTMRGELRHPKDVFSRYSLDSLKMIPVTNDHPQEFVTSENADRVSVGFVGENVIVDGDTVSIPFKITDKKTITDVENGKNQLSLGYETDMTNETGEWEKEKYTSRQINIRYNHLAIVDKARAGEIAQIKLDSAGNMTTKKKKDNINIKPERVKKMATIRIDSIDYDNQAPEVSQFINKMTDKLDSAKKRIDELEKEKSKLDAEKDTALEKVKELEKVDMSAEIEKAVKERIAIVDSAIAIVKDLKTDGKSNEDLQKEVILSRFPEAKLDGKDSVYIQARYDAVIESVSVDNVGGQKRIVLDSNYRVDDVEDARAEMLKRRNGGK